MNKLILLAPLLLWGTAHAVTADDVDCSKCVDASELDTNAVAGRHLKPNVVSTDKVADKSITQAKLATESVSRGKLQDGAVSYKKMDPKVKQTIEDMQDEIDELKDYIEKLQAYIEVDEETNPEQPVVRVVAANFQIVNGEGDTSTINGLGNLIVGYDEADESAPATCSYGEYVDEETCTENFERWGTSFKSGSHNLVVGPGHSYSMHGGFVAGESNVVNFLNTSVTGGLNNIASGSWATVSGGFSNYSAGYYSAILGGHFNTAEGQYSTVSGGFSNQASGEASSVSGGASVGALGINDWAAGDLFQDE